MDVTRVVDTLMSSSKRAASSAYPSVSILMLPNWTPLPLMLSCLRRMSSKANMKYRGDVISPCTTPRSIANGSDMISVPSVLATLVVADAAAYIALNRARLLWDAPAAFKALSINLCDTESNAAL